MVLNVETINCVRSAWHLVDFTRVCPDIGVVNQSLLVALRERNSNDKKKKRKAFKLRERGEKKNSKVEKAGFDPAAAAPSQPDRLDVSRSDHSVMLLN